MDGPQRSGRAGRAVLAGVQPSWSVGGPTPTAVFGDREAWQARAGGLIWLAFLAIPLTAAFGRTPRPGDGHLTAVVVVTTVFACSYAGVSLLSDERRAAIPRPTQIALVAWYVAALGFLCLYDDGGWSYCFTYTLFPLFRLVRRPFPVVAGSALLTGAMALGGGLSLANTVGPVATVGGVGLSFVSFMRLTEANHALRQARDDHARMAVAEERVRFSRDLHDLLGHSLSVITLKAEVAGRLLPDHPDQAGREVAEIEAVAREALREVRDTVTGYRRATLAVELAGARRALAAAGIAWEEDVVAPELAPDVEGCLAWALREGVTNVIRHSGAQSCRISVGAVGPDAVVCVEDDGRTSDADVDRPGSGNGLRGLAERVALAGGTLVAAVAPGGGFCLRASVPLDAGGGGGVASAGAVVAGGGGGVTSAGAVVAPGPAEVVPPAGAEPSHR